MHCCNNLGPETIEQKTILQVKMGCSGMISFQYVDPNMISFWRDYTLHLGANLHLSCLSRSDSDWTNFEILSHIFWLDPWFNDQCLSFGSCLQILADPVNLKIVSLPDMTPQWTWWSNKEFTITLIEVVFKNKTPNTAPQAIELLIRPLLFEDLLVLASWWPYCRAGNKGRPQGHKASGLGCLTHWPWCPSIVGSI
jgi:hypothetical protein